MVFIAVLLAAVSNYTEARTSYESDCLTCHAYPATSLWLTVDKASVEVPAGGTFTITAEGGGGTDEGSELKYPSGVADNGLFSYSDRSVTGSTGNLTLTSTITAPSTAGTYTLRIYITCGSGKNAAEASVTKETAYKDITVNVTGKELDLTTWGVQVLMGTVLIAAVTFFAVKIVTGKSTRRS